MPLVEDSANSETPEQKLAREARERLSELTRSMLMVYANLMNYQHNNGDGVSVEKFHKALGADAKDFKSIMGSMKRMLLKLNPSLKPQLNEMVTKRTKKVQA